MSQAVKEPESADDLLDQSRAFWREVGRDMVRNSIETAESTAKQIIVVTGILEGLYFHAITFGDLRTGSLNGRQVLIYLVPIFLLLLSLTAALLVFFRRTYKFNFNSSEASQLLFEGTVRWKQWFLWIASFFLVLGVLAILIAVGTYLANP
jgi:hypothetical protein